MTNREFFEAIVTLNPSDELTQFAVDAITKLDHRNELRKGQESKSKRENASVKDSIVALVSACEEGIIAVDIAKALSTEESPISPNKVTALCTALVKDGILTAEKVKVGKSKVNQYKVA